MPISCPEGAAVNSRIMRSMMFLFSGSNSLLSLNSYNLTTIQAGACLAPATLGFLTFFFSIGQVAGPFTAGRIADGFGSYANAFILAGVAVTPEAAGQTSDVRTIMSGDSS